MLNYKKYKRVPVVDFPERQWPGRQIEKAPIWCSVDLRDGNQALIEPMVVEEKMEMFRLLVKMGFKEIEIGFPAASQIEFDFLRQLVERRMIPDDVTVQVLTQCREHLIRRTFEAIQGVKKAIVHIYNSTSTLQRDVVFHKEREEIKEIAVEGVRLVKKYLQAHDGEVILEYSPESFTGTELDFALDICTAVQEEWQPTPEKKMIINLPATVEMTTPNVYADQIEWMNHHFKDRDSIILSIHPHNDRGTGIAATELALLAGAERVEGTLLGNGERTGNVDILNIAYNMFSQGINPELEIENMQRDCGRLRAVYQDAGGSPAIHTLESWYLRHFPVLTRTLSARECRPFQRERTASGRFPICLSTQAISAGNTSRWSASTASPARAAWPLSWIPSTASSFQRECTRNLRTSFRKLRRPRERWIRSRSLQSSRRITSSERSRFTSENARLRIERWTRASSLQWQM